MSRYRDSCLALVPPPTHPATDAGAWHAEPAAGDQDYLAGGTVAREPRPDPADGRSAPWTRVPMFLMFRAPRAH